ncbi:MAG TPA: hypothetical protein EYO55_08145 [Gammaproteobacteria bacterium]|jgi:hypothetical protein|nr:hypothetical protein [Gammaproteobacteria bacterium]
MFELFGQNSKARQLIKDSQSIIRADELTYADKHLFKISEVAGDSIRQALNRSAAQAKREKIPRWLKEAHRDARKRNDQAALSGTTLAIIFLQARELGDLAQPASGAIEEFIARWPADEKTSAQAAKEQTLDG